MPRSARPGRAPPTTVAGLDTRLTLAAAGVGLAVVPRRAVGPGRRVDVCELREPWERRPHLPAWGAKADASPTAEATAALAAHPRAAALAEPARSPGAPDRPEAADRTRPGSRPGLALPGDSGTAPGRSPARPAVRLGRRGAARSCLPR
ncbi:hypothetical protein OG875_27650 [Streptomyces sp. NBC_01498]|uniref:hypothetical protein n=1 Tax=Streptomyces sp. NBC_01498 TaxID=2975870 RepID=UPI002E7ADF4E|nr:hypothetical protein [Streptomyces sp. NBC_01498]WTL28016.1 hypothetical protein OG875_27650 [Streptomyces sp. NBC_01498]